MKRFITVFLSIVSLASCQKPPELTLSSLDVIGVSSEGSSGHITFTANRDWSAACSESWIHVSPSSGPAADGEITVSIRCDANTTYDDRSGTVTIRAEELSRTVTVQQPANLGIILATQLFDLQSGENTLEVEVQANVQYSVSSSAYWIRQTGTRGLTSRTLSFSVEANDGYNAREGQITIKPQDAGVQEQVILVRQAQKDALEVGKASYSMPYGGGTVEVKVEANVAFDVIPDAEWIHYGNTRGFQESVISLTVDENMTYSPRTGSVEIRQKDGPLSHTVSIRQAERIAVTSITLDRSNMMLYEGDASHRISATVKPDNATDKTVTWHSSDPQVASVDAEGKVTAVKEGTATITATAGEKSASCTVSVYPEDPPFDAVDLGLSVKWANRNLGAERIENPGGYYAWGETETKSVYSWETYKFGNGTAHSLKKYCSDPGYGNTDGRFLLEPEDDAAHVILGGAWRIPTPNEWQELVDKCTWTYGRKMNDSGYYVSSNVPGYEGRTIFLPLSGCRKGNNYEGGYGCYWSAVTDYPLSAWSMSFYQYNLEPGGNQGRYYGYVIRPVNGPAASVFRLAKDSVGLLPGGSERLELTIQPLGSDPGEIAWTSDDTSVATVSDGVVTAVAVGTCTITASAGHTTASCKVRVYTADEVAKSVLIAKVQGFTIYYDGSCSRSYLIRNNSPFDITLVNLMANSSVISLSGQTLKAGSSIQKSLKYSSSSIDPVVTLTFSFNGRNYKVSTGS